MKKIDRDSGAIQVGIEACKLAFILNGGGSVALLAFLGGAKGETLHCVAQAASLSLTLMAVGAACVPVALAFAYSAIHAQAKKSDGRLWKVLQVLSMVVAAASVALFVSAVFWLAPELAKLSAK